jgi:pilus assembly protein CpaC
MHQERAGSSSIWAHIALAVVLCPCWMLLPGTASAQNGGPAIQQPVPTADGAVQALRGSRSREKALIAEVRETELKLEVEPRFSKIITTKKKVSRVSITDPHIVEVVQFSPTQFELIGLFPGETSLTLWFADPDVEEGEMLRYQVRVAPSELEEDRRKLEYSALERKINELFPNSFVHLFAVGNKLIIRGQARDSREAADIVQIARNEGPEFAGGGYNGRGPYGYGGYGGWGGYGGYGGYGGWGGYGGYGGYGGWGGNGAWGGNWAGGGGWNGFLGANIINMLEIPGEKQVMLKVRVAELSRSAMREIGTNLRLNFGDFTFATNFALNGTVTAVLNTQDMLLTMEALATNGYSKILAEPNLVTLSGFPANFLVGGQFAVPTAVGVQGIGAVTTSFKSFGTQLTFTPTVLDKALPTAATKLPKLTIFAAKQEIRGYW